MSHTTLGNPVALAVHGFKLFVTGVVAGLLQLSGLVRLFWQDALLVEGETQPQCWGCRRCA